MEQKLKLGQVNIAVNNVGKILKKPISDASGEEYDDMYFPAIHRDS